MRNPSALRRCVGFAKRATDNSPASLPFDVLDYTGLTHMHNRVIRGKYAAHLHFATKGASVALSAQSRQNPRDNSFTFCQRITKGVTGFPGRTPASDELTARELCKFRLCHDQNLHFRQVLIMASRATCNARALAPFAASHSLVESTRFALVACLRRPFAVCSRSVRGLFA